MIQVALLEPEIPQNTGNIARTCACVGVRLNLTEPMGFRLSERNLKRAGCDYWDDVEIEHWSCTQEFLDAMQREGLPLYFFTGSAERSYAQISYEQDAVLVFGRESRGIDPEILDAHPERCVRIPMRADERSLNLSNAVAIGVYEACRQLGFPGLI